jgi:hypothetical protein
MSRRSVSWVLFVALLVAAPLPFFLVETGWVPLARLIQLAAYTVALILAEGGQGAVTMAAVILLVQVLVYTAVLALVARWIAGALLRLAPRRAAAATALLVAVSLGTAASVAVYRTPFSTSSLRSSLLGVFR